jgi:hypothetical protein
MRAKMQKGTPNISPAQFPTPVNATFPKTNREATPNTPSTPNRGMNQAQGDQTEGDQERSTKLPTSSEDKLIRFPSGEKLSIKVPPAAERNLHKFIAQKCRFHIPKSAIEEKLVKEVYPSTEVPLQELGTNNIPEENLWTGTKEAWKKIHVEHRGTAQQKRLEKIQTIRSAQQALRKLNKKDWEALKKVLSIQRIYGA